MDKEQITEQLKNASNKVVDNVKNFDKDQAKQQTINFANNVKTDIKNFKTISKRKRIIYVVVGILLILLLFNVFSGGKNNDLSPKNVQIGKEVKSLDDANKSTQFVCMLVWEEFSNVLPNAKWDTFKVQETDGCGRYVVYVKYLKNVTDTHFSYEDSIVYWVDDTHYGKYTAVGDVSTMKQQVKWGTKIDTSN